MRRLNSISDLPSKPSVYAMYSGKGRRAYCAYVGVADNLKRRVAQHLIRRDSSVTTGTSAVSLNPDYITEVRWWEHPEFPKRHFLEAAELIAFKILDPVLRSRGNIQEQSKALFADSEFAEKIEDLFKGEPAGCLMILTLQDALEMIERLEKRLDALEEVLKSPKA